MIEDIIGFTKVSFNCVTNFIMFALFLGDIAVSVLKKFNLIIYQKWILYFFF